MKHQKSLSFNKAERGSIRYLTYSIRTESATSSKSVCDFINTAERKKNVWRTKVIFTFQYGDVVAFLAISVLFVPVVRVWYVDLPVLAIFACRSECAVKYHHICNQTNSRWNFTNFIYNFKSNFVLSYNFHIYLLISIAKRFSSSLP